MQIGDPSVKQRRIDASGPLQVIFEETHFQHAFMRHDAAQFVKGTDGIMLQRRPEEVLLTDENKHVEDDRSKQQGRIIERLKGPVAQIDILLFLLPVGE